MIKHSALPNGPIKENKIFFLPQKYQMASSIQDLKLVPKSTYSTLFNLAILCDKILGTARQKITTIVNIIPNTKQLIKGTSENPT